MVFISKRRLANVLAATLFASVLPAAPAAFAQETVVFAGFGGSIMAAQRKVYFDAFEKETGIKVIDVPDSGLPKIKAMVNSGNVQWDVANTLGMYVHQGIKENLWEKLDQKVVGAAGIPKELRNDYGIGNAAYGQILAYNTKLSGGVNAPKTWADFWNVSGKAGPRGLFDGPRYILEFALMADGVAPKDLYPLDVDRAFASLDKIKSKVSIWWKQWPQVPILLSSGEINMSNMSNARIQDIVATEKVPLEIVWNQGLMTVDWLVVPRGAKNPANAMKLIAFMSRPDLQAKFAQATNIGPVNADSISLMSAEEQQKLPSVHYKNGEMGLVDDAWWAENSDKMIQRWDSWKLK
ncbi:polyamine ABC transporter substrate-binding protein [Metarhizobium album]|uniref:Polyamine ABC transporter substrate-binding protein n=1 Tax=Metarhizobium album TaxID=2182425 RepID=A0A2U2DKD3_9HYPH|nr:ABC transporter substrate-binding protein [Rhizobium album]PWE53711.1 polyamine ABC transporter substrate-binding protein [Rhizobium album]